MTTTYLTLARSQILNHAAVVKGGVEAAAAVATTVLTVALVVPAMAQSPTEATTAAAAVGLALPRLQPTVTAVSSHSMDLGTLTSRQIRLPETWADRMLVVGWKGMLAWMPAQRLQIQAWI
jgi:hypothetical protein